MIYSLFPLHSSSLCCLMFLFLLAFPFVLCACSLVVCAFRVRACRRAFRGQGVRGRHFISANRVVIKSPFKKSLLTHVTNVAKRLRGKRVLLFRQLFPRKLLYSMVFGSRCDSLRLVVEFICRSKFLAVLMLD